MHDLIKDLGLAVPHDDPEPDPNPNFATWVAWFRRRTHCDLKMAMNAAKRRREEWAAMRVLTNP
jgi:hypothetical protein